MALYINGNKTGGGNANVIRLTQAEYDALPPSKLTDNNIYMITDANGDGSQFQPVIYSEDEREIGVWIDGKPLYQKTLVFNNISRGRVDDLHHNIANIDQIAYCNWQFVDDTGTILIGSETTNTSFWCDIFNVSSTGISYRLGTEWTGMTTLRTTLQYTKTTDTPGSGTWTPQGVPAVHYNTDEQVVGTWIDGSTLYEKTYSVNFTYGSLTCDVAFSDISNLNSIIDLKGILANAVPFTLNGVINNSNKLIITSLHQYEEYGYIGPDGIRVKRGDILWYGDTPSVIVTIRYTKSTI